MRGYFGIGAEEISKPMNMGNIVRSAHAFGASFVFTINAYYSVRAARSDTSKTPNHLPYYEWDSIADITLPKGCQMVGVELTEEAGGGGTGASRAVVVDGGAEDEGAYGVAL